MLYCRVVFFCVFGFCVTFFRVWSFVLYFYALWYFVLYFSVCGILCYIFLRVERALVLCFSACATRSPYSYYWSASVSTYNDHSVVVVFYSPNRSQRETRLCPYLVTVLF